MKSAATDWIYDPAGGRLSRQCASPLGEADMMLRAGPNEAGTFEYFAS